LPLHRRSPGWWVGLVVALIEQQHRMPSFDLHYWDSQPGTLYVLLFYSSPLAFFSHAFSISYEIQHDSHQTTTSNAKCIEGLRLALGIRNQVRCICLCTFQMKILTNTNTLHCFTCILISYEIHAHQLAWLHGKS
jgi:hypothetical protein